MAEGCVFTRRVPNVGADGSAFADAAGRAPDAVAAENPINAEDAEARRPAPNVAGVEDAKGLS